MLVAKTTHQTATASTTNNDANTYNESQLLIANPTLHYSQSTCRNSQAENNKSKSIHGHHTTASEHNNLMKNYFYTFKSTKPTSCSATTTSSSNSTTTKSNLAFRKKNKFISANICNNLKKMSHENQSNESRQLYSAENYDEEFVIIEPIEASSRLNSPVLLSSKAIKSCESVDTSSNTSPVVSSKIKNY